MITDLDRTTRAAARVPENPAQFVAEAQRMTNERDVDAVMTVYGPHPVLQLVTEGAVERHAGTHEIRSAWSTLLGVFERRDVLVEKTVIAVDDGVIVNGWESVVAGPAMRGLEVWAFDEGARVVRHLAHTFLDVKPATSWHAQSRVLISAPRLAVALGSARRRAGREA